MWGTRGFVVTKLDLRLFSSFFLRPAVQPRRQSPGTFCSGFAARNINEDSFIVLILFLGPGAPSK